MSGHQRWEIANTGLMAATTLGGIAVLTPLLGIVGAAVAVMLGLVAANVARLAEYYALFRTHPFDGDAWRFLAAGALASGVWALVVGPGPDGTLGAALFHLAFGALVLGGTYLAVVWVWGLTPAERDLARQGLLRARERTR